MFFFFICTAAVFILFVGFVLELEMHFFCPIFFFSIFRFTCFSRVLFSYIL